MIALTVAAPGSRRLFPGGLDAIDETSRGAAVVDPGARAHYT